MDKEFALRIPYGIPKRVRFTLFSENEKNSLIPIVPRESSSDQMSMFSELNSTRLGVIFQEENECPTCGGKAGDQDPSVLCPGHLGVVKFGYDIFHPMIVDDLAILMNCFCPNCYHLKFFKLFQEADRELAITALNRLRDTTPTLNFLPKLADISTTIVCCERNIVYKKKASGTSKNGVAAQPTILAISKSTRGSSMKQSKDQDQLMDAHACKLLISRYNKDDITLLGLKKDHVESFIISSIQVGSRAVRPSIRTDGTTAEDQLTEMYVSLFRNIRDCNSNSLSAGGGSTGIKSQIGPNDIYNAYKNLISAKGLNTDGGSVPTKGIFERLSGKYGRMRSNLMGKRVNYCSRSVITGDPTISINELGVPRSVASRLTFPEVVTARNRDFLMKLVSNGNRYPGAVSKTLPSGTVQLIDTQVINSTGWGSSTDADGRLGGEATNDPLPLGTIVNRHLLDGDYVLFNRQPTLHKSSFMGHRVRVLPYSTYRLNLSATSSYNADFDGDEMNLHALQSLEAVAEISELCMVSNQVVSVKDNRPIVYIVQDVLLGCYLFTGKDVTIPFARVCEYVMWMGFSRTSDPTYAHKLQRYDKGSVHQRAHSSSSTPYDSSDHTSGSYNPAEYDSSSYLIGNSATGSVFDGRGSYLSTGNHSSNISRKAYEDNINNDNGAYFKRLGSNVNTNDHVLLSISQPAICYPQARWTGKQVFSMFVPKGIFYRSGDPKDISAHADKYVAFLDGSVMCGRIASSVVGGTESALIHILFRDYGVEPCRAFIDNCQRVICRFMLDHGFSVGMGDMVSSQYTEKKVAEIQTKLSKDIVELFKLSVHYKIKLAPGQSRNDAFEQEVISKVSGTSLALEKVITDAVPHRNALLVMINAGSKGKKFNMMQISSSLGQQFLQSKRMPHRFETHRALPCYSPFSSLNMESRGYIFNSFIRGLNPAEFYFHAVGGREGVCDTAVKTADSGYVERKLLKVMESVCYRYDNSVRNDSNEIISFRYGDDGIDPHKSESHEFTDFSISDMDFLRAHYIDWSQIIDFQNVEGDEETDFYATLVREKFSLIAAKLRDTPEQFSHLCDGVSFYEVCDDELKAKGFDNLVLDNNLVSFTELSSYLQNHYSLFMDAENSPGYVRENIDDSWLDIGVKSSLVLERDFAISTILVEYIVLLLERVWLQRSRINLDTDVKKFTFGMNLDRIIQSEILAGSINKVSRLIHGSAWKCYLKPFEAIEKVNKLLSRIRSFRPKESTLFRVTLRQCLSSKSCCYKYRFTGEQLDRVLATIEEKFVRGQAAPGEPVGPLAGHSVSEPATQLTLNTFHTAGTSALGGLGLPRLKELIDFRDPKISVSTIYLNIPDQEHGRAGGDGIDDRHNNQFSMLFNRSPVPHPNSYNVSSAEEATGRNIRQSKAWMNLAAKIEYTTFNYYIDNYKLIFDPFDEITSVAADRDWLTLESEIGHLQQQAYGERPNDIVRFYSPFVLRYEIGLKQMQQKIEAGITIQTLVSRLMLALQKIYTSRAGHAKVDDDDDDDEDDINTKQKSMIGREMPIIDYYTGLGKTIIRVRPSLTEDEYTAIKGSTIGGGAPDIEKGRLSVERYDGIDTFLRDIHISGNESIRKVFMASSNPLVHYGYDSFTSNVDAFSQSSCDELSTHKLTEADLGKIGSIGRFTQANNDISELYLQTDGSDLLWILTQPEVDFTRTWTTNVREVYETLGIEAARTLFIKQIRATLDKVDLNIHHYLILADIMSSRPQNNKMISINRYGMQATNTGVLAQATFERPGATVLKAAAFGVVDPLKSVSSCVVMGKQGDFGTGCFDLLLNCAELPSVNEDELFPNSYYLKIHTATTEIRPSTGAEETPVDSMGMPFSTTFISPTATAMVTPTSAYTASSVRSVVSAGGRVDANMNPMFSPGCNRSRQAENVSRIFSSYTANTLTSAKSSLPTQLTLTSRSRGLSNIVDGRDSRIASITSAINSKMSAFSMTSCNSINSFRSALASKASTHSNQYDTSDLVDVKGAGRYGIFTHSTNMSYENTAASIRNSGGMFASRSGSASSVRSQSATNIDASAADSGQSGELRDNNEDDNNDYAEW